MGKDEGRDYMEDLLLKIVKFKEERNDELFSNIVDGLKQINVDSSYNYRSKLAKANGISNYSGTAEQNTKLLNLLKQGKLIAA